MVYMTDDIKAALDQVATQERRSLSSMAEFLLFEALQARGLLTPEDTKSGKGEE
ncbi:MAG: hypothetical protein WBA10_14215 [Elainellaceae cyanobacterium]